MASCLPRSYRSPSTEEREWGQTQAMNREAFNPDTWLTPVERLVFRLLHGLPAGDLSEDGMSQQDVRQGLLNDPASAEQTQGPLSQSDVAQILLAERLLRSSHPVPSEDPKMEEDQWNSALREARRRPLELDRLTQRVKKINDRGLWKLKLWIALPELDKDEYDIIRRKEIHNKSFQYIADAMALSLRDVIYYHLTAELKIFELLGYPYLDSRRQFHKDLCDNRARVLEGTQLLITRYVTIERRPLKTILSLPGIANFIDIFRILLGSERRIYAALEKREPISELRTKLIELLAKPSISGEEIAVVAFRRLHGMEFKDIARMIDQDNVTSTQASYRRTCEKLGLPPTAKDRRNG